MVGELADLDHLLVEATVDSLEMRLFDYALKNAAPIRLTLDRHVITVHDLQIVGEDTSSRVLGRVGLADERIALQATGGREPRHPAGLLPRCARVGTGRAAREHRWPAPQSGLLGQRRHYQRPHSPPLAPERARRHQRRRPLRLTRHPTRRGDSPMGGGPIQFGGRIGLEGYLPGELNVLITGQDMHLRYPEGIQSIVDVDLTLRGNVKAPVVGGTVSVQSAVWTRRLDAPGSIFDLAARTSSAGEGGATSGDMAAPVPIRFDLEIKAPSAFRMDTNLLQLTASADLTLQGTYDKPILLGRAEVDRGVANFEGRRYRVTHGTLDFNNRVRIEPFIDVEAETNVRVPGQTYRVVVSVTGTPSRLAGRRSNPIPRCRRPRWSRCS